MNPVRARRNEEKELRRQVILDAAEDIVAKRTWEGTNFGEIAKLARLSRSLVYVYFPTRDHLFHAMCDRGLALLEERFARVMKQRKTGLEQVVALGRAYYQYSLEETFYFNLLSQFQMRELILEDQTDSEQSANSHGQRCLQILAQAIANGVQDGTIRASIGEPGPASFAIWGFTHGLIQLSTFKEPMLQHEYRMTARKMIERGLDLLKGTLIPNNRNR